MRNRTLIGLVVLTLTAGVAASGLLVVAERALSPSPISSPVAGTGTPEVHPAPPRIDPPAPPDHVTRTEVRVVFVLPELTPVTPDAPTAVEPSSCCRSAERHRSGEKPPGC